MLEQIQQALAGDQEQFQALYGQYQPVIYKCMKKYYLKDYDTEDWLQEGRIVFFRTLERFDSEKQASLGKFFKRNFENHEHSLIRHQCAYKRRTDTLSISLEQRLESAGEELVDYLGTAATDPLGQLMIQEKLAAFPTRLSSLEQQILNAYLKGYTLEEIAKVRGGTFSAVRSAYDRAKAKMKYTLENE